MAVDVGIQGEPQLFDDGNAHFTFVNRGDAPLAAQGTLAHIALSTSDDGGRPQQTLWSYDDHVIDPLPPGETFDRQIPLGVESLGDGLYRLQATGTVESSVLLFHVHNHRATLWNGDPATIPADMRFRAMQATVYFSVTFDAQTTTEAMQQRLAAAINQALTTDSAQDYNHGEVQVWLAPAS